MSKPKRQKSRFVTKQNVPLGAVKCSTFPSSRNILTSSIPPMFWTLIFFNAVCSFLSSCAELAAVRFTILRRWPAASQAHGDTTRRNA